MSKWRVGYRPIGHASVEPKWIGTRDSFEEADELAVSMQSSDGINLYVLDVVHDEPPRTRPKVVNITHFPQADCICPKDGIYHLCPVHKTRSSPR